MGDEKMIVEYAGVGGALEACFVGRLWEMST